MNLDNYLDVLVGQTFINSKYGVYEEDLEYPEDWELPEGTKAAWVRDGYSSMQLPVTEFDCRGKVITSAMIGTDYDRDPIILLEFEGSDYLFIFYGNDTINTVESYGIQHTERGFAYSKFEDRYGYKCSLQKSSIATEDCVWFGVDDPSVKVLVPGRGWQDVDIPEDASIYSRMHLNREQVAGILPYLQKFVETGELE